MTEVLGHIFIKELKICQTTVILFKSIIDVKEWIISTANFWVNDK